MSWPLRILSFLSPLRYTFQGIIINEFQNRTEYDNPEACKLQGPKRSACDPFTIFDFYEKTRWLNMLILVILIFFIFFLAYFIFVTKYSEKKARMEYDEKIVDKYAFLSKEPLFKRKK